MVKRTTNIKVAPESIIRNITNFFSDHHSYAQELMQNCRRAEASKVIVTADFKTKNITIEDNGHGVFDPESLITIGQSDWATKVQQEMPAGMGLFSAFKVCKKLSVRSGTWELTIDYSRRNQKDPVTITSALPSMKGTIVTLHNTNEDDWGGIVQNPSTATGKKWYELHTPVSDFAGAALYMPFETELRDINVPHDKPYPKAIVELMNRTVPPFNIANYDTLLVTDHPWGRLAIVSVPSKNADHDKHNHQLAVSDKFICQGIGFSVDRLNVFPHGNARNGNYSETSLGVAIIANPGTVDFTLPDRDALIKNEKYVAFQLEVRTAIQNAWVTLLNDEKLSDEWKMRVANEFVSQFGSVRDKLPKEWWLVQLGNTPYPHKRVRIRDIAGPNHTIIRCADSDLNRFMRADGLSFLHTVDDVVEFEWLQKWGVHGKLLQDLRFSVIDDPRDDTLVIVKKITAKTMEGKRVRVPMIEDYCLIWSDRDSLDHDVVYLDTKDEYSVGTNDGFFALHTYGEDDAIEDYEQTDTVSEHTTEDVLECSDDQYYWPTLDVVLAIKKTTGKLGAYWSHTEDLHVNLNTFGPFNHVVCELRDLQADYRNGFYIESVLVIYRLGSHEDSRKLYKSVFMEADGPDLKQISGRVVKAVGNDYKPVDSKVYDLQDLEEADAFFENDARKKFYADLKKNPESADLEKIGAKTGRFDSSKPNLSNPPRDEEE